MMASKLRIGIRTLSILALAAFVFAAASQPAAAQVTIPQGSIVNSAYFSVFSPYVTNQVVNIHQVTSDWGELSVTWNNFAGHYDGGILRSFTTDVMGWHSVDITDLVQAWVSGALPNFGIVMIQPANTTGTTFISSEHANLPYRPKLELNYTTPAGVFHSVVIQRPGAEADGVADAYVTQQYPFGNYGTEMTLITGNVNGYEKYSLVRFHFDVIPSSPGTGTPGYWMNHPEAWPVPAITIGGITYSMDEAIALMQAPVAGDKTFTLFSALVAAKLNVLIGNDASCVSATIAAADAWMAMYPVGSGIAAGKGSPWREAESLNYILDSYNNGLLCAPHRD